MEYAALLSLLSETMSISGQEHTAKEVLKTHIAPLFDEYLCDSVGNQCLVRRCGQANAKKLVLDAHFDEIGMMVKEISPSGFLRVCAVGGLDLRTLQATPVLIYAKEVLTGVISSTPPHLSSKKDATLPNVEDLWIDTGFSAKELAEKGVGIGTPIGFATPFHALQDGCLCGRSFDNKACCAAAILAAVTAKAPQGWDIYVLLSAKEEIGGGGARSACCAIRPNLAIVLDANIGKVSLAPDYETVQVGQGVSISLSATTDRHLTEQIIGLAKDASIPYQRIVEATSTGTNADLVSLAHNGIPCAVISLPLRHMHTPCEVIAASDAEAMIALLCTLIERGLCTWDLL